MLGWTQAEPEWDDEQRRAMLDLLDYESALCPDCGLHETLHDPRHRFEQQITVCEIAAARTISQRRLAVVDAEAEKRLESMPDAEKAKVRRPGDGRRLTLREIAPVTTEATETTEGGPRGDTA